MTSSRGAGGEVLDPPRGPQTPPGDPKTPVGTQKSSPGNPKTHRGGSQIHLDGSKPTWANPNPPGGSKISKWRGQNPPRIPEISTQEPKISSGGVPNTPGETQTYLGRAQNQHLQGQKVLGNLKVHLGTPKSTPNSAGQTQTYLEDLKSTWMDPKSTRGPQNQHLVTPNPPGRVLISPGRTQNPPGDPRITTWESQNPPR